MDPISALGLASNIIQIVDFSSRVISRGHEIYASGGLEEHTFLDDAARNLSELTADLRHWENPRKRHSTAADKQLLELTRECKGVSTKLQNALERAQLKPGNRKLQSIYQALRSVCGQKEISDLERRLDNIRKQIDTALLVSLRKAIGDFTKSPTPGDSATIDDEAERRHFELLNAIRECNWQPSRTDDVNKFSNQFHSTADAEVETRFRNMILARLYFPSMSNRGDSISEAHSTTFEWIFRETVQNSSSTSWDSFPSWLKQKESGIYWVTGKPGSGKSTLMKFLFQHPQLPELLGEWAKGDPVSIAGFYFWNSGTVMQMSRLGLLQTLLHSCLKANRQLIRSVFSERWEQFIAYGGGQDTFDWQELQRALKQVLSDTSKKFFLLIDGLDEFDGKPEEIIDFIVGTVLPNVKICVASRPWLPFGHAFGKKPNLLLERLTYQDISRYVNWHCDNNEFFRHLALLEPESASNLVRQIITRANGVFLWVYVVVQSLLTGLLNSDRMPDLQARLDALPSDLEALFDKLLSSLGPGYFKMACQAFRLLREYRKMDWRIGDPTLLEMYFADDEDTKSSLMSPLSPLPSALADSKAEEMRRRLTARCRGFLEVRSSIYQAHTRDHTVTYLHRTARDFVEADHYWATIVESAGGDAFQPDERWANACFWCLKSFPNIKFGEYRRGCVSYALSIQRRTMVVRKTYVDEVYSYYDTPAERLRALINDILRIESERNATIIPYLSLVLEQSNVTYRRDLVKWIARLIRASEVGSLKGELQKLVDHYDQRPRILKFLRRRSPQLSLLPYE